VASFDINGPPIRSPLGRTLEEARMDSATNAHLERKHLRAYHRKLQDFIIRATNVDGLRYRLNRNSIVLYPLDDSLPMTVYARSNERQVRSINQWYAKHGPQQVKVPAIVVDDPEDGDEVTVEEAVPNFLDWAPTAEEVPSPTDEPTPPPAEDDEHWSQYIGSNGEPIQNFETDGAWYRCTICRGTATEYISDTPVGIGGHIRMNHTDTTGLFTPEAREKGLDTKRFNRLSRQVTEALDILVKSVDYQQHNTAAEKKIARLERENADLTRRLEEAEARLALIRESMGA
jgi:hypothetical protein